MRRSGTGAVPALIQRGWRDGSSGRGRGSQPPSGNWEPVSELLGFCWFKLDP